MEEKIVMKCIFKTISFLPGYLLKEKHFVAIYEKRKYSTHDIININPRIALKSNNGEYRLYGQGISSCRTKNNSNLTTSKQ